MYLFYEGNNKICFNTYHFTLYFCQYGRQHSQYIIDITMHVDIISKTHMNTNMQKLQINSNDLAFKIL